MSSAAVRDFPPPSGTRSAIVTGGSQGIGRATAEALALDGWNVLISGRRVEALQATVKSITARVRPEEARTEAQVRMYVGDMGEEEAVQNMFARAVELFGQVDLVFVNAGMSAPAVPIQELSFQQWNSVVHVNLNGAFLCGREAFRYMDGSRGTQGGRIILNGSISSKVPRPHSSAYTSTKHAITGLTKSLALDGRKYNIAVSQIDIGNASSAMTQRMSGSGVLQADGETIRTEPVFDSEFVAKEIVHIANLPLTVNIQDVTIMATTMPSYVGRG